MSFASTLNASAGPCIATPNTQTAATAATAMAATTSCSRGKLKHDIRTALESINATGSFAAGAALTTPPPADISVTGVGNIRMPLEETQAKELIALSRQAPYGKRAETIVDTSVRNTWELDVSQFTFSSPEWSSYLAGLCAKVAEDLGVKQKIKADIYKMLIYEKGAMFKAHTDTEKIPGMFGTLVLSLPSQHQGGDVVLKHCGMKKTVKTSTSPYSYACWYSDVTHEVLPVTSGYRWVLTFNLAPDPSELQQIVSMTTGLQQLEIQQLRESLRQWLDLGGSQLYHILDHDYTEANISLKALKGADLARVQTLRHVLSDLPFEIFLALLEKEEFQEDDDDWENCMEERDENEDEDEDEDEVDDEVDDEDGSGDSDAGTLKSQSDSQDTYTIKALEDLSGNVVMTNIRFSKESLLDEECFDGLEPDDEHQGYAGNEGGGSQYWYRLAALVIVPRDSVASFLAHEPGPYSGFDNTQTLIRYWAQECRKSPSSGPSIRIMDYLCDRAWSTWHEQVDKPHGIDRPPISGSSMQEAIMTAIQLKRYDLFEIYATRHQAALPLEFFSWMRAQIGLGEQGDLELSNKFDHAKQGLHHAIFHYGSLSLQYQAIVKLVFPEECLLILPAITVWVRETLNSCVDARIFKRLLAEDGVALINLSLYVEDPIEFLSATVAKIVGRTDAPAFFFNFLARLRELSADGTFSSEKGTLLYVTTAGQFIENLELPGLRAVSDYVDNDAKYPRYSIYHQAPKTTDPRFIVSSDNVIDFAFTLLSVTRPEGDGGDLMSLFLSKLMADATILPSAEFRLLWNPFLVGLVGIFKQKAIRLDAPMNQSLYSWMLNAYVDGYVGQEPSVDKSLVRSPVGCRCTGCHALNAFLINPDLKIDTFPIADTRRRHLQEKLEAANTDCNHEVSRVGRPFTLIVTKTFKQNQYSRDSWRTRRLTAEQDLQRYEQHDLVLLLGQEGYQRVTGMQHLMVTGNTVGGRRAGAPAPTARHPVLGTSSMGNRRIPQPAPHGFAPPAAAGVKRQYSGSEDVIDLTKD